MTQEKRWVTKYCLSEGIFELHGGEVIHCTVGDCYRKAQLFLKDGKDCYPTPKAALDAARDMAAERIASLEKQIKKLEKLALKPKVKKGHSCE